jgi:hypothetical protein
MEELLVHLEQEHFATVRALRRERFTLRLIAAAQRSGHLTIHLDGDEPIVRATRMGQHDAGPSVEPRHVVW